jgi:hypothetical protein
MFQTSAGTQHAKRAGAPVWSIVPPIWSSKSRSASPWHDERRSETRLSAAAGGGRLRGADMPMSAEECRAHAETCERMAQSLGPGKCRPPRCHARGRRSVASARGGRRGQGASQFKLTHYPPSAADADFSGAGLRVRIRFPPAESQSLSRIRYRRSRTPAFRAGVRGWLGDPVGRDAQGVSISRQPGAI